MRVISWNLWWQFGPWQQRQPAIAAELARVRPDIALIQEVWAGSEGDQAEILAATSDLHVARTRRDDGEPQPFGNAILSRWPILSSETIRLPDDHGRSSHRSAIAAIIDTPAGPQIFVCTHLAWQYGAAPLRMRQLQDVVDFIVRLSAENPDAPGVILGGDFNAVPESDEIRRLTGMATPFTPGLVFTDCWAAVGDGPGHTWTRDNPHSADALWPRRRLDYIFVSWPRPKPLSNPVAATLAGTTAIDPGQSEDLSGAEGPIVPSDHYAVVVDLDDRQTLDHG